MDRHSNVLERRREEHIARYAALSFDDYLNSRYRMPKPIDNDFAVIEAPRHVHDAVDANEGVAAEAKIAAGI
jgi:hypothetical protein